MKLDRIFTIRLVLVFVLVMIAGISAAQEPELDQANPVSTAITYQGRLDKGGEPVDATCDMTFRLYDRETTGSQAGLTVSDSVSVSDGLFTISLDFGPGVFDGKARWLEIAVQCPGDAAATTLPRVALTAAPYAHYALEAPWDGIQNMPSGFADGVDDDTQYRAGWGLRQQSTAFSVDERLVQTRVVNPCGSASAIQKINEDGSVECEALQGPLTAVDPLDLTGNTISLNQGAGSGLDADTLDAKDSTEYLILAENQTVSGSPTFGNTTPFSVTNDTLIPNLNAEWLGGKNTSQYFRLDAGEVVSAENKTTFLGQVVFDVSPAFNANPPFSVGGPNKVANLNTDLLDGLDSNEFFQLDKNGQVVSGTTTFEGGATFNSRPAFNGGETGISAPFTVDSTDKVVNLNADTLDGQDSSTFLTSANLTNYFNLTENETVEGDTTFDNNTTTVFNGDVTFGGTSRPAFNGGTGSSSPFTVSSPAAMVENLNADMLDGNHASAFASSSHSHAHGALTGLDADDHPQYFNLGKSGQTVSGNNTTFSNGVTFTSRPAFNGGTPGVDSPFTVDSDVPVASLNADMVDGRHAGNADGNIPISNGTLNANLNADLLDGDDASVFARVGTFSLSGEYTAEVYNTGSDEQIMTSTSNSFCFLVLVEFVDVDGGDEFAQCDIYASGGNWVLQADVKDGDDADAYCQARCFTYKP